MELKIVNRNAPDIRQWLGISEDLATTAKIKITELLQNGVKDVAQQKAAMEELAALCNTTEETVWVISGLAMAALQASCPFCPVRFNDSIP